MSADTPPNPPVVGDVPQYVIDFYNNLKNEFIASTQGAPVTKGDLDAAVTAIVSAINSAGVSAADQALLDGVVAITQSLAVAANLVPVAQSTPSS